MDMPQKLRGGGLNARHHLIAVSRLRPGYLAAGWNMQGALLVASERGQIAALHRSGRENMQRQGSDRHRDRKSY
jgi:hypothetical protein